MGEHLEEIGGQQCPFSRLRRPVGAADALEGLADLGVVERGRRPKSRRLMDIGDRGEPPRDGRWAMGRRKVSYIVTDGLRLSRSLMTGS
jgi:hypothetical protein